MVLTFSSVSVKGAHFFLPNRSGVPASGRPLTDILGKLCVWDLHGRPVLKQAVRVRTSHGPGRTAFSFGVVSFADAETVPLPHFLSKYETLFRVAKEGAHTSEIEQKGPEHTARLAELHPAAPRTIHQSSR